jgi:hypothetical protein
MTEGLNLNSTWKSSNSPRGKSHKTTENKTTVSLYLEKSLVERAKKQGLNISRVTEQALSSIIDYMELQFRQTSSNLSLSRGSLSQEREILMCRGQGLNLRQLGLQPSALPG